ncbi:MAG: hypothetical protein IJM80_04020 [Firmicutes bacterium]|nr:hypothetical protein [Bacillota bacterium]
MNKKSILLAALVAALAVLTAFCSGRALGSADDISFTLETVYGDPSAIEGLEIHDIVTALHDGPYPTKDNTVWTSSVRIENGRPVTVDSVVSGAAAGDLQPTVYRNCQGYRISAVFDAGDQNEMRYNSHMEDLVKDVDYPHDAKAPLKIRLSQLCDYYPYSLDVVLPEGFKVTEDDIRDFLKIPVLDEQQVWLMLKAGPNSDTLWGSYRPSDGEGFALRTFGGMYKGDYLFTFCNKTYSGANVDCSQIPLGYGIYRLSEDGTFSLFKRLDEADTIVHFGVSLDESRMFLHRVRDGRYVVEVLDAKSLEVISSSDLREYDWSGEIKARVFEGRGSETVAFVRDYSWGAQWNTDRVYLITDDAAHDLRLAALNAVRDGIIIDSFCPSVYSASSAGGKTVIVSRACYVHYSKESGGEHSIYGEDLRSSVMIHVTGPDGTVYAGILRSSLDDGQQTRRCGIGPFYTKDMVIYDVYYNEIDAGRMYVLW